MRTVTAVSFLTLRCYKGVSLSIRKYFCLGEGVIDQRNCAIGTSFAK